MSNIQAAKLIIENIQYLGQAKILLEGEVTEKLFVALDTIVQEHIDGLKEWSGVFDLNQSTSLKFAPETWRAKQGDDFNFKNFYARYYLDAESSVTSGDSNEWWLSTFLKNDIERVIFSFYPCFDNFKEKVNKTKWSKFANDQNQLVPQIVEAGFKFNTSNGCWYLIVEGIEPKTFIEGYENNDLVEALTPITDALKVIEKTHDHFDKIVQAAILQFGCLEKE